MRILKFRLERKANPNGKIVCVSGDVLNGVIFDIKICGDFFLFPNEKIVDLENGIKGLAPDYDVLLKVISEVVCDAYVMGFTPKDLSEIICEACNKDKE